MEPVILAIIAVCILLFLIVIAWLVPLGFVDYRDCSGC